MGGRGEGGKGPIESGVVVGTPFTVVNWLSFDVFEWDLVMRREYLRGDL